MNLEAIKKEIQYAASRSSGSGGQHVNKVATKVELRWNILTSEGVNEDEKIVLLDKLQNRLVQGGILQIFNQETRSQVRNKDLGWHQLSTLIKEALVVPKERKKARKNKSADRKRLQEKSLHSEKKSLRKKVNLNQIDLF